MTPQERLEHLEQENAELIERKTHWLNLWLETNARLRYYTTGQYDKELKAALLKALLPSSALGQYISGEQEIKDLLNSVKL